VRGSIHAIFFERPTGSKKDAFIEGGKMHKVIRFLLITDYWLLITFVSSVSGAGEGTTTALFLQLPQGGREIGMGGCAMAIAEGPGASYYNPAGLVGLKKRALNASYTQWLTDFQTGVVNYVQPLGKTVIGFSAVYLGIKGIEGELSADKGVVYGTFAGGSKSFGFGVNLKGVYLGYGEEATGMGIALDAGIQLKPSGAVALGVGVQNVGPEMTIKAGERESKDKLPTNIKVGVAIKPKRGLTIAGDFDKPSYGENKFHMGVEYWFGDKFALRVGWQTMEKELGELKDFLDAPGLSAGIGFKGSWAGAEEEEWFEEEGAARRKPLQMDLQVDYGMFTFGKGLSEGDTNQLMHLISLGIKF